MIVDFLIEIFRKNKDKEAIVWNNQSYSYDWLYREFLWSFVKLEEYAISAGTVVELHGDFSPKAIAMLLALIEKCCIVVPTTKSVEHKRADFLSLAQVEYSIVIDHMDNAHCSFVNNKGDHPLIETLRKISVPGLILFSSGSTGKPKAILHDFSRLLEKFKQPRSCKRMINFLLFDHIGGINTLLHTLSNQGCVITLTERTPETVCKAVEQYQVQVLPTSPTFLNLLLLSGVYANYKLSSLELVTYGTEVMPESTLQRFHQVFPNVKLSQTYGLTELGILRVKSQSSTSLYMKVGGEGYQTRVVNGLLEIKAESAMLGYLNAENPFTEDGWFKTGDLVEMEGEYLKILGRSSEIINVGGEKVYPAEVESVIQMMEGVSDVAVSSELHPIIGQIVKAKIKLSRAESLSEFRIRMRSFCKERLAEYKIPQKVIITDDFSHNARFKRMRNTL